MNTTYHVQSGSNELKLHDDTIQVLFGIGLKIEYCLEVFDESRGQVKDGLDGVIADIGDLIEDIRGRIDALNISGRGGQESQETLH